MKSWRVAYSAVILGTLPARVLTTSTLQTSGFSTCNGNGTISVQKVDLSYNNDNKTVNFDVAGTSDKVQNVTAMLNVTAYGNSIYSNSFNPCATETFVQQLCPVPAGSFAANGSLTIPPQYASMVPAIAFSIPDISAQATLRLQSLSTGQDVACITSQVTNGQTVNVAAVSYVTASMAAVALLLGGASAMLSLVTGGGGAVGIGSSGPSFFDFITIFQGYAMNGMMSVNYPSVYRAFTKNFAFSTGLIPIISIQRGIDSIRAATGGNLTDDNVNALQNATLIYSDGSITSNSKLLLRSLTTTDTLAIRQFTTSVNNTLTSTSVPSQVQLKVSGISAYVEQLSVPQANTFLTVLLVIAVIIAAIAIGILAFKGALELWALFGSFPESLVGFRKHYWGTMARAIVQLILMAYGVLVLYSIFQFTRGDSWLAKALAALVLASFTGVLAFFTFRIWQTARRLKDDEGDVSQLYEDKQIWLKYSLFYDAYKQSFWWTFIPAITYMFAKGCALAVADGHGLAQTVSQLIIEGVMLIFLITIRPYERRSGNIINIFIQVVRVLSVICILVFVEELAVPQTAQTVTGVVLIAIQSALTAALAALLVINTVIVCCKANPHRKRRKEAEKLHRDLDDLTSLEPHNSLLFMPGRPKASLYVTSSGRTIEKASITASSTDLDRLPKLPILATTTTESVSESVPVGPRIWQAYTTPNAYSTNGSRALPAPIGGPYTAANSYRNLVPQKPYPPFAPQRPTVQTSVTGQSREHLVGAVAPLGGREPMSQYFGYRGWQ